MSENTNTTTDAAAWVGWMTAVTTAAQAVAARAVLEEPALTGLIDPSAAAPVVVVDPALGRADVWFKVANGQAVHAGHVDRAGQWWCAAVAPAVEPTHQPH